MAKCVQCGYCCRVGACAYGQWDYVRKQCSSLTDDNLCEIYDMVKHDEGSPAMGWGCSSTLCNTDREEKIRAMGKVA